MEFQHTLDGNEKMSQLPTKINFLDIFISSWIKTFLHLGIVIFVWKNRNATP